MQRGYNKNERFKVSWDDQQGIVVTGRGSSSWTTEEYRDTNFRMPFLSNNQDDDIHQVYQMTHRYDGESNAKLHLHALPMASASGIVYLEYQWCWLPAGVEIPALSGWNTGNISLSVDAADQYKGKIYSLLDMVNSNNAGESSILRLYISRLGTNVNDTYSGNKDHGTGAANFGIDYFDLHIGCNKVGTDNDLPPFNN
jgi:hypothetical protein